MNFVQYGNQKGDRPSGEMLARSEETVSLESGSHSILVGSLAIARVEEGYEWHLKTDDSGRYRWYVDGQIETQLSGMSFEDAAKALRGFAERTCLGELQIREVELHDAMEQASELWQRLHDLRTAIMNVVSNSSIVTEAWESLEQLWPEVQVEINAALVGAEAPAVPLKPRTNRE